MNHDPGDLTSPERVWCSWNNRHEILTQDQSWMVIRLANAELARLGAIGPCYVPVAWMDEQPILVTDSRRSESCGWIYVTELFSELPEYERKLVIHS